MKRFNKQLQVYYTSSIKWHCMIEHQFGISVSEQNLRGVLCKVIWGVVASEQSRGVTGDR